MNETILTTPKRLDSASAAELGSQVEKMLAEEPECFVIEMKDTVYICSLGLRVILGAQKNMNKRKCPMIIRHVSEQVREVFDITGFSGFLNIEDED